MADTTPAHANDDTTPAPRAAAAADAGKRRRDASPHALAGASRDGVTPPSGDRKFVDLGVPNRVAGNALFFPLAAAYAVFVVPASVLSMLGAIPPVPGVASPAGHAHELLFGFALAVVAGNQLGPRSRANLGTLVAAWLLARLAFLGWPGSLVAVAANVAFPALLAYALAPRLLASAKKWRNQSLPLTLIGLCASAVAFAIVSAMQAPGHGAPAVPDRLLDVAVALFALLLLFMGGRVIAPAVAGQFYRQGQVLDARVQPRIEGALVIVMAIAVLALILAGAAHASAAVPVATLTAGFALIVAAVLAALRMVRWRLWALHGRPDLLCQAAGYGWLAVGLLAFGAGLALDAPPAERTRAIHVITIGSLGTLTLNVMAMTRLLRARRPVWSSRLPVVGTLLLALALVFRVAAGSTLDTRAMLIAAAACWSLAYLLLLVLLMTVTPRPGPGASEAP